VTPQRTNGLTSIARLTEKEGAVIMVINAKRNGGQTVMEQDERIEKSILAEVTIDVITSETAKCQDSLKMSSIKGTMKADKKIVYNTDQNSRGD
jgi:hypothetical protein